MLIRELFKRSLLFLLVYAVGFFSFLSFPAPVTDEVATQFQNLFGALGNSYQLAFFPGYNAIRIKSFLFNRYASDIFSDYPVSYPASTLLFYFALALASFRASFRWLSGFIAGTFVVLSLCFFQFFAFCYHFVYFDYLPHTPLAQEVLTAQKVKWVDNGYSLSMLLLYLAPVAGWVLCMWGEFNALLRKAVSYSRSEPSESPDKPAG